MLEGVSLRTGPVMATADKVLHNKACRARDLRVPLDVLAGPCVIGWDLERVALDSHTTLVFGQDHSFFLHHDGRSLPFSFLPASWYQRTPIAVWAREHLDVWANIARSDWCLAPARPTALPHPSLCPFWLPISGMASEGEGRGPVLEALDALVSTVALDADPGCLGWNVRVFPGTVNGILQSFTPGFVTIDPPDDGAGGTGDRIMHIQQRIQQDGRLHTLMASHHALVHALGTDSSSRLVSAAGQRVAMLHIGATSAHDRMRGLAHLADLLDTLSAALPATQDA